MTLQQQQQQLLLQQQQQQQHYGLDHNTSCQQHYTTINETTRRIEQHQQ